MNTRLDWNDLKQKFVEQQIISDRQVKVSTELAK